MSDKRYAVVHFTDGTKLKLEFPKQSDASSVVNKMKNLLDSSALMLEADGSLITIPMSSIKYIQSYPCPEVLPDFAIKGASIVD